MPRIKILQQIDLGDSDHSQAVSNTPFVDRPTKFTVMPRSGDTSNIRWLKMPGRHMLHELNCWEEDGSMKTHGETTQKVRRWTIDLTGATNEVKEEALNDRDIQFPRPDDRYMTRQTRHGYANASQNSVRGREDGLDSILHFDTKTGKEDFYHFGAGAVCGELIFATRLGSENETDGYAMSLDHPSNAHHTELVIFQALDVAQGPIARVIISYRILCGFHCNYYSAESPLYAGALH